MTTATTTRETTSLGRQVLRRWPSAVGLVTAAAVLVLVHDRLTAAITVCVATLCYLGAAALNRRWIAWVGVVGGSVIVPIALLVGLPWWLLMGVVGAALFVVGLFVGVPRRPLTAQAVAMAVYGVLAVAALLLAPSAGLVMVGAVLACHAIWDAVHYRRNTVVHRSLAEFCMFLDAPLGVGLVIIGLAG